MPRDRNAKNCRLLKAGGSFCFGSYSIVIELPEESFFTSFFGTMTVRTPDSYFALMSSGFTSPI